jgi:GntR family transcriptional regulator
MTGLPPKAAAEEPDAERSSRLAVTATAAATSRHKISQRRRRLARCRASAISGARENERRGAWADIRLLLLAPMLNVKIDRREQTDLFEQVAAEIRRAIADGEAKPGERLPPARDLAAVLGVNTNTVLRSLRLLRDEGLLEFRRGLGIRVAGTPEQGAVLTRARELVRFARQNGYRTDELIKIIESVGS